ncbi:hypothetical protein Q7P37_011483 [Cladosporium fusiforme]
MSRLAIDELWACLCPSWNATTLLRAPGRIPRARRTPQCLNAPTTRAHSSAPAYLEDRPLNQKRLEARSRHFDAVYDPTNKENARLYKEAVPKWRIQEAKEATKEPAVDLSTLPISSLYARMKAAAAKGEYLKVREVVEHLVRDRREKPSVEHYDALILSNISANQGTAWRVHALLAEMQQAGIQVDTSTCHAVLKVLAVHPDHLLRTDVLEYMRSKWMGLSEDGEHDITAGLLRGGLFEQALERLDGMGRRDIAARGWLLDMFVYMLCEAGELGEAYNIMHGRHLAGELNVSRTLWHYFLDKASAGDHLEATSLAWKTQVNLGYINPSSGTCLNVLTTASRTGDAYLATAVFTHLSKRGESFTHIHYQLLIDAYLSASPPDINRALSILTLMPVEKLQPTAWQTRSLFERLRKNPDRCNDALADLRTLHEDGRIIPVAALNVLIEAWVSQRNLPEALKIYKQIHTFAPEASSSQRPAVANVETFNLLLRGCRTANPPDEAQASFLVSELLALRVRPNALTYDRLILVFIASSEHHSRLATESSKAGDEDAAEKSKARATTLLDWATRHFMDMQPLGWMPRFGTVEKLATQLATARDSRCWDVLQMAGDAGEEKIEGWAEKGRWAWSNVEKDWETASTKAGIQEDFVSPRFDEWANDAAVQ